MTTVTLKPGIRQTATEEQTLNLTPLIDIIFILIFFFFLSMEFRREVPTVEVNLPQLQDDGSSAEVPAEERLLIISLTEDGEIFLNDLTVPTARENLLSALEGYVAEGILDVQLRVDGESQSGLLLDVFKQCQEAGFDAVDVPFEQQEPER